MSDYRHQGGERFTIELRALPDDVPPTVRLRQWLKSALRSARFRAMSVRDTTPQLPPLTTGVTAEDVRSDPRPSSEATNLKR
jgi:hypothetical protein